MHCLSLTAAGAAPCSSYLHARCILVFLLTWVSGGVIQVRDAAESVRSAAEEERAVLERSAKQEAALIRAAENRVALAEAKVKAMVRNGLLTQQNLPPRSMLVL